MYLLMGVGFCRAEVIFHPEHGLIDDHVASQLHFISKHHRPVPGKWSMEDWRIFVSLFRAYFVGWLRHSLGEEKSPDVCCEVNCLKFNHYHLIHFSLSLCL